jgi:hypothetical protein
MSCNARTIVLALALTLAAAGCFSVQHRLPPNAYFGTLPKGAAVDAGVPFDDQTFKNWALAGLVPYSGWTSSDLLATQPGVGSAKAIQIRQIETIFSPLDVVISIVPGAFYGYYVWAPRTIHVAGAVQSEARK